MYTLTYEGRRAHFLAMPRTASKSCRDALRQLGAETVGGHHDITQFDEVVKPGDLVISTVRNHWDWLASFWELNSCPGKFDRYVPKLCRESEWIRRNPDRTRCELFWKYAPRSTVILRFERVEREFRQALIDHGFPDIGKLPASTEKKARPYQSYYGRSTQQLVENKFGEEIAKYGYTFE